MPTRAPVFGKPNGVARRRAWAPALDRADRRLRGRAGVKLRALVRSEEPFCRACLARGLEVATDEIDHIRRLADGGSDHRSNLQGLCKPCHDAKSAAEQAADRADRRGA